MYTTISETVNAFDQYIDNTNEPVYVLGQSFNPSDVLKENDPIAYKCYWLEWCDFWGINTDELENDYTFKRDTW